MPELEEPSDVSSGESSEVEKSNTPRGSASVELTDLPLLVPSTGDPADRAKEEMAEFWKASPISTEGFDDLNEEQLTAVGDWMTQVNTKFNSKLKALREELQAEWQAKEHVMDQLLQACIGDSLKQ